LNKNIVNEIKELKGEVTGLKGHENIIHVEKKKATRDLGFVGTITSVEQKVIEDHLQQGNITVIAPLGISVEQQPHNVNADEVACAVAISLKAEKLVLLTNVQGVLKDFNDPNSLLPTLTVSQIAYGLLLHRLDKPPLLHQEGFPPRAGGL
jgi:acetylglutamate kinase